MAFRMGPPVCDGSMGTQAAVIGTGRLLCLKAGDGMENRGLEPLTSAVRSQRSTS
jgi:hypothetical protein